MSNKYTELMQKTVRDLNGAWPSNNPSHMHLYISTLSHTYRTTRNWLSQIEDAEWQLIGLKTTFKECAESIYDTLCLKQTGQIEITSETAINPPHYKSHPSGVECIQVTEHMSFCLGNAVKYIWRNGLKEGQSSVQDLKKAIWYIEREIQRISEENKDE